MMRLGPLAELPVGDTPDAGLMDRDGHRFNDPLERFPWIVVTSCPHDSMHFGIGIEDNVFTVAELA